MPKEDTNEKILGLLHQALQPIESKLDSLQQTLVQIWQELLGDDASCDEGAQSNEEIELE